MADSPLNRVGHDPENPNGTLTGDEIDRRAFIQFRMQKGPVDEVGVNGCFLQDIIEMTIEQIDRYDYEHPELACRENALAKTNLETAWYNLQMRRDARQRQGVLSTMQPHGTMPKLLKETYRTALESQPVDITMKRPLNLKTDLFPSPN